MRKSAAALFCFSLLAGVNLLAESGKLVLDTKARSKKENVRILEDYVKGRQ